MTDRGRPHLAILVPPLGAGPSEPAPPAMLPLGRAALACEGDGVPIVFAASAVGGYARGFRAAADGWVETDAVPIAAAYDRFPSASRPGAYAELLTGLPGVPVANSPAVAELCRDKLRAQAALDGAVRVPEVEADPDRFAERLAAWGAAYHKPRYGSFGVGVRRVAPGDDVGPTTVGAEGVPEPALLQRAIAPPSGWQGACARVLVQRDPRTGAFTAVTPVVRRSRTDPVANAARGAEVTTADDAYPAHVVQALARAAVAAARAVADAAGGDLAVEIGVDIVAGDDGVPWVIEVNGRPRGRLEALVAADPARWSDEHVAACRRPLDYLAARFLRRA